MRAQHVLSHVDGNFATPFKPFQDLSIDKFGIVERVLNIYAEQTSLLWHREFSHEGCRSRCDLEYGCTKITSSDLGFNVAVVQTFLSTFHNKGHVAYLGN